MEGFHFPNPFRNPSASRLTQRIEIAMMNISARLQDTSRTQAAEVACELRLG